MSDADPSQAQKLILYGNAAFANRLYQILCRKPGNVLFSPLSVHAVLCMAHQGAKGETAKVLDDVLEIPEAPVAALGYHTMTDGLKSLEKVLVYLAFKMYVREEEELDEAFVDNVRKRFSSDVESVDFGDVHRVVDAVNEWVEKQTAQKITKIVDADFVTADTVMLLVNAVYFKGAWWRKFYPGMTNVVKFYVSEDDSVDVAMMHKLERGLYKRDEELKAQVLVLPFIERQFKMVFVLPEARNGIAFLESKLSSCGVTGLLENLDDEDVLLSLPKFKLETTMHLGQVLAEAGLGHIFTREANFSGILKTGSKDMCVGKIIQKAYIDVNEVGAEAAAVTVLQKFKKSGSYVEETVPFVVDHPAMFLLVGDVEGAMNILFWGRLSRPTY